MNTVTILFCSNSSIWDVKDAYKNNIDNRGFIRGYDAAVAR
jgi:hypothetical protein